MHFSGFFCCYSVSHCSYKPTIKIIDWSLLCQWANIQNQQGIKYFFSPLYTHPKHFEWGFFSDICCFFWILLGRSALIEFGHRSRVNVSVLRIMSEPYGTNRERLKARAGCEMANRCFRRGRFPTHPSDDWTRCWQLHVSIWEQINVKLYDTYIRALGVCGKVQTDRRGHRETARNRKRLMQTPNNTWCLGIIQTCLPPPPPPPPPFPTSRLAWIQTDSSQHYKQKAHLLPATKGNPSDVQEDLRDFIFALSAQ